MAMAVRRGIAGVALGIQALVVRAVRMERVSVDAAPAGRHRPATDRLDHRVALRGYKNRPKSCPLGTKRGWAEWADVGDRACP